MSNEHEEEGTRSFTRALDAIADGDLVIDAGEELHKLLRQLRAEGDRRHGDVKGTFTLKLAITVERGGVVEIRPTITAKASDRKLSRGTLWMTPGGNLTPENPRQQKLGLREVTASVGKTRDVNDNDSVEAREV